MTTSPRTPEASPTPPATRTRLRHAGFGVLATLVAVSLAHLVAALTMPAASPVLTVGSTVIDLTPTPVKEWAVAQFGTADKPILIGSVLVVVLLLAALAGMIAARKRAVGIAALVGLASLSGVLALLRPEASAWHAVPGVVAAIAGGASLWWLHRLDQTRPAGTPAEAATRRTVLLAAGGLAALAVVAGAAGRWTTQLRLRSALALPPPSQELPPLPAGLEGKVEGLAPWVTPSEDFYRIDTRLILPIVDPARWTLTIDGDVEREVRFTMDELLAMPLIERDITLTCVSNPVGGPYVGGARWLGVPLRELLDRAGIERTGADQILSADVDGMTISTPLTVALDGRDSMIAVGMNGNPLPVAHGFPARMVVPGLYGFVSACKWITRMTLTTYAAQSAYWTDRGWSIDGPVKLSSRIDTPVALSTIPAGKTAIGGIAWAQPVGVSNVEVRIDGGAWLQATLGPDAGHDFWRQWYLPWDASPGQHFLAVRVTDRDGTVQTAARAAPFPEGSSGIQEISVTVG